MVFVSMSNKHKIELHANGTFSCKQIRIRNLKKASGNLLMRVAPGICGGWVIINYAVEDDDLTIS
jgi:hypothetical protein